MPMLAGGLGNLLFQLAGAYGLCKHYGYTFVIDPAHRWQKAHHSKLNYFENGGFLSKWRQFARSVPIHNVIHEHKLHPIEIPAKTNSYISGYLQNYEYFWNQWYAITQLLNFDTSVAAKYPRLEESAFLHLRGGDYRGHELHFVDLTSYYKQAIQQVGASHYYVFTNDPEYLAQQTWLADVPHTVVNENEIDSLYLMSRCAKGAICANSSFSWWGAALSPSGRPICMPSKWFNDPGFYIRGYFFPGVAVIAV